MFERRHFETHSGTRYQSWWAFYFVYEIPCSLVSNDNHFKNFAVWNSVIFVMAVISRNNLYVVTVIACFFILALEGNKYSSSSNKCQKDENGKESCPKDEEEDEICFYGEPEENLFQWDPVEVSKRFI